MNELIPHADDLLLWDIGVRFSHLRTRPCRCLANDFHGLQDCVLVQSAPLKFGKRQPTCKAHCIARCQKHVEQERLIMPHRQSVRNRGWLPVGCDFGSLRPLRGRPNRICDRVHGSALPACGPCPTTSGVPWVRIAGAHLYRSLAEILSQHRAKKCKLFDLPALTESRYVGLRHVELCIHRQTAQLVPVPSSTLSNLVTKASFRALEPPNRMRVTP